MPLRPEFGCTEDRRLPAIALWIALFLGFSPTLIDLVRHWTSEPWAAPSAGFVPLWILAMRSHTHGARRRPLGLVLVVAGLLLATFAATGGVTRWGRFGLPTAVLGLALWLGTPPAARAILVAWWIPFPHFVQSALFIPLSRFAESLAIHAQAWTGGAPIFAGRQMLPAIDGVPIGPADLGLQSCWLLAGVAWYAGTARGFDLRKTTGLALRAALLGIPIQMLALVLVVPLTLLGSSLLARDFLDLIVLLVAICALIWLASGGHLNGAAPFGRRARS